MYNPPKPSGPLTWAEILAEEPFQGQHWEGVYGLPPGSTVEGWEAQSSGSDPSLSPWEDDYGRDDCSDSLSLAGSVTSVRFEEDEGSLAIDGGRNDDDVLKDVPEFYRHRQAFEDLQARQYWREEWRMRVDLDRPFSFGDHSTLAPSLNRIQKGSALGIFGTAAHEVRQLLPHFDAGLMTIVRNTSPNIMPSAKCSWAFKASRTSCSAWWTLGNASFRTRFEGSHSGLRRSS